MCIAGAIIGAAVIGAAGTAIAGSQSASAIESSTNASIAAQQQAQQKQQQILSPYTALGGGAMQQYQNLLGTGPPGSPSPEATLAATPGYQFAKSQGSQGVLNAASAMGLTLSGNTLEGLDKFNTGLADQTYQNAVSNAQNAVTIGENAAAGTGAGILQTGGNVGSALLAQGNTLAGIDANVAAGLTKSAGNAANQYITANTLKNLNPGGGGGGPTYGDIYGTGYAGSGGYDPVANPELIYPG